MGEKVGKIVIVFFFFLSIDNYNSPKNLFHKKVSCRRRDF